MNVIKVKNNNATVMLNFVFNKKKYVNLYPRIITIMCQTTTPITWSQTKEFLVPWVPEQRNSLQGITRKIQIRTNLKKNITKLVFFVVFSCLGIEPESSASSATMQTVRLPNKSYLEIRDLQWKLYE